MTTRDTASPTEQAGNGSRYLPAYLRMLWRYDPWRVGLSVALMVLLGFTQGLGLLLLIPALKIIGVGDTGAASDQGGSLLQSAFERVGLPLTLPWVLVVYFLIVVVQALANHRQQVLNAELINGFTLHLRDRFSRALTYARWMTFVRTRASDFIHALTSEITRVAGATRLMLTLPGNVLIACVHVAVAFSISPVLTGAALLCGTLLLLVMVPYNRRVERSGKALRESSNSMYGSIMEFLAGMKVTKSYGLEDRHLELFARSSSEIARQLVHFTATISRAGMFFQIGTAAAVGAFLWGAVTIADLSADRLLVLVYIFTRLLPRFRQIQSGYHKILHSLPAFEAVTRMQEDLETHREPAPTAESEGFPLVEGLRFEDVSFGYDGTEGTCAVQNIDLTIPAGRMTAVLGASGAGKSTLADLMMGLLVPDEGRILIDNRPLTPDLLHAWRRSVGYVPQDTFLFHDSIRNNLQWARPGASDEDLREALQAAAALRFVTELPEGLETVVGDRGVRLSGGERQRVALARAFLRRPALLLLDEATSSLDTGNEDTIQAAVERRRGELTVVVIAHRLSTVSRADHVVVLERGKVVETGTWQELSRLPQSHLRAMIDIQP